VTIVERELKLAAPSATVLPPLSDPLAGVVAEPAGTRHLLASYFDTDDLRLTRAGASLRHRDDEGWAVKLPGGATRSGRLDRATYAFPGEPGAPPPEALDLVRALTRRAPVGLVARLRTTRRAVQLRTTAGDPIGEVVDDDVTVLGDGAPVRGFRELEFELADGAPEAQVTAIVARLRAAGAGPPDPTPKIVRALAPRAAEPPDVGPPDHPPVSAGDVVRAALADALARLIAHDPGMRRGDDPEDVHQARVATRRLRSHLRSFAPLLDAPTDDVRDELRWLADTLGQVRDADVLLERLEARLPDLPPEDRAPADRLLDRLRTQQCRGREQLLVGLRSDRYAALLDRLVEVARVADLGAAAGGESDDADQAALRAVVRPAWEHLRDAVATLGDPPTDGELHAVRRHAKRARYAAEAVEPAFGKPAREFVRAVTAVQTVLGEHQDAVIAAQWLRDAATRGPDERAAFAAGELAAAERGYAHAARDAFPAAWRDASRKSQRRWL
jgi:CHAD domain-containing protein